MQATCFYSLFGQNITPAELDVFACMKQAPADMTHIPQLANMSTTAGFQDLEFQRILDNQEEEEKLFAPYGEQLAEKGKSKFLRFQESWLPNPDMCSTGHHKLQLDTTGQHTLVTLF